MESSSEMNIDEKTIDEIGLKISNKEINAHIAPNARVFEYPGLEDVYIMESDLYGNTMPEGSCFLAFYGSHGLIGKHLHLETLRTASINQIKTMVESHSEG